MNYYSTYIICGWLNPQTTEPQIRRADSKVVRGFWTAQRVSILDPCAVEASVAFASPLNRWGKPQGFPGGSDDKKSACNAGDLGWIPGLGRARWATVHEVAKRWTLLSDFQQMNTLRF